MKKLIPTVIATLISFGAFAQSESVNKYYDLLTPENKAKAALGQIAEIKLIEADPNLVNKRSASISSSLGSTKQALVDARTCYAELYVEAVELGSSADCGESESFYINNANIAVEMDFQTFSYDTTAVNVKLYAQTKLGSYNPLLLVDDIFIMESDYRGSGANTVVYIVNGTYAYDYDIFADVILDDERGTACIVETNSATIQ